MPRETFTPTSQQQTPAVRPTPGLAPTPATPGITRQKPRTDSLNRPVTFRPRTVSPAAPLPTGADNFGTVPGGTVLPQAPSSTQVTNTGTPWYMNTKIMIPVYLGAVALFYLMYKKR